MYTQDGTEQFPGEEAWRGRGGAAADKREEVLKMTGGYGIILPAMPIVLRIDATKHSVLDVVSRNS